MELGSKGVGNYGNTYNSTILWGAMLARAGADSISANNREPYSAATREYVISQNPEIIIIGGSRWSGGASDQMQMGFTVDRKTAEKCLEAFMHRSLWQNLPAVKNRRFYAVDHGSLRSIIDWHMSAFIAKVCWPEGFATWIRKPASSPTISAISRISIRPAPLRSRSETNRRAPRV